MNATLASAFPIRIVAEQTGIPAETLRMWERRYGFPKPLRRAGGSRVYREADVARLRLIARARDAGYRPGDVMELDDQRLAELAPPPEPQRPLLSSTPADLDGLIVAIKQNDVPSVRSMLRTLARLHGPRSFVTDVAHPLALRIGAEWECGGLFVHQEHLASNLLSTQLRILLSTLEDTEDAQRNANAPLVVLATLPGESHILGLEMIAVFLATLGAVPRLLGADTPPAQIASAAEAMQASVVGLSITNVRDDAQTKRDLDELKRRLRRIAISPSLWLGGAGAARVSPKSRSLVATFGEIAEGLTSLRRARTLR